MNPDPSTRFLESLCNLDADEVSGQLCDDARLSIRSGLFAAGKPRIKKALKRGISSLISIRYVPAAVWIQDNVSVIEADVTCERLDGSRTLFPVTLILRFRDHLIEDIRLYTYETAALGSFLQ
jgi:hypothetical protein